jgi:hypothetical protein
MKRVLTLTAALAVAVTLLAASAAPAFAQGMIPRGFGPRPALAAPAAGAPTLPIDQAATRARQYLAQFQNPDLVPGEVIEFTNVLYVVVQERSTGKGAFGLLVDRVTGNVAPEMGPPMMWNTRYGRWAGGMMGAGPAPGFGPGAGPGAFGGGMMGRGMMGYGMMGPGFGPGARPGVGPGAQPVPARPTVPQDEARARAALQAWLTQAFPGAGIGKAVEFPGFFSYRLTRDGRTFALAAVHAYSGQVWYAWQYGAFVREQVVR